MPGIHYLARAEADHGYPLMDFEDWYQHGMDCYYAQLPVALRRQALGALSKRWAASGKEVAFWMLRAFVYGARGLDSSGQRTPIVSQDYRWPTPPDAAWELVICCYPDGECDLDLVHPVSRRFWSEDNGFFDPPGEGKGARYFTRHWYVRMGFDVMNFHPDAVATVGPSTCHLSVVRKNSQSSLKEKHG